MEFPDYENGKFTESQSFIHQVCFLPGNAENIDYVEFIVEICLNPLFIKSVFSPYLGGVIMTTKRTNLVSILYSSSLFSPEHIVKGSYHRYVCTSVSILYSSSLFSPQLAK